MRTAMNTYTTVEIPTERTDLDEEIAMYLVKAAMSAEGYDKHLAGIVVMRELARQFPSADITEINTEWEKRIALTTMPQLESQQASSTSTSKPDKFLYCFNCRIGLMHGWVQGRWQCLNCGMRREDEPESSPYNDDDPGDIPPELDLALEQRFEEMCYENPRVYESDDDDLAQADYQEW